MATMMLDDTDQQHQIPRSPLDYLSAFSIVVTAIGFLSRWLPLDLVQGISAYVMGTGIVCAVTTTFFRIIGTPLAGRYLERTDRNALQQLRVENPDATGIVFQRSRGLWMTLVARVAGTSYKDFGYRVFMQCPERLWSHGAIGQVVGYRALQGDEFDHMVHGGGPVGEQAAIDQLRQFVETHDRRFGTTASSLLEIERLIKAYHEEALQLLLPEAKAKASSVVDVGQAEPVTDRLDDLVYQFESMVMACKFIRTVHYRLTKTDKEAISVTDIEVEPGYHAPNEYVLMPLMLAPHSRVATDHDGLIEFTISQAHKSLMAGWVIGRSGDILHPTAGNRAFNAFDEVQSEHPNVSLQETADRTLKRYNDTRSNNDG